MHKFPENFFWGGSTSSSQIEGGYNEGGRGLTIQDVVTAGTKDSPRLFTYTDQNGNPGSYPQFGGKLPEGAQYSLNSGNYYPNLTAVDFYHHWKEDIHLLAGMGFRMFRMSICWSRIYPDGIEDSPNEEGLQFYRNIFLELKKYRIEPLVTLWHGETPLYLENHFGGWKNKEIIPLFEKYVKTVFKAYKGLVHYWLTFNEINNILMFLDIMPEELAQQEAQTSFEILHNRLVASALAVKTVHEIDPENHIGNMIAYAVSYPYSCNPSDVSANMEYMQRIDYYAADVQMRGKYPSFSEKIWDQYHVHLNITEDEKKILKEGTVDFFSFSYYSTSVVCAEKPDGAEEAGGNFTGGIKNPYLTYSEWGWAMDPEGLRIALNQINDRYQCPVIVVENGLGASDALENNGRVHDPYRILYIREHIKALSYALEDGVNLFGYLTWGCIDEISATTGEMKKRYGYIYVDRDNQGKGTLKRYRKDSFYWYQKVIASNGTDLE